jgi:hypothetical protein
MMLNWLKTHRLRRWVENLSYNVFSTTRLVVPFLGINLGESSKLGLYFIAGSLFETSVGLRALSGGIGDTEFVGKMLYFRSYRDKPVHLFKISMGYTRFNDVDAMVVANSAEEALDEGVASIPSFMKKGLVITSCRLKELGDSANIIDLRPEVWPK